MIIITADRLQMLEKVDALWFQDLLLSFEVICRLVEITPDIITVCGLDSLTPIRMKNSLRKTITLDAAQPYQWVRVEAQLTRGIFIASNLQSIYKGASLLDSQVRMMLEEQTKYILERVMPLPEPS